VQTEATAARHRAAWLAGAALACSVACGGASQGEAVSPKARAPLPADVVAKAALPLYAQRGDEKLMEPALWQALAKERVICFGEQHDDPAHHFAQRRALEELAARSAAENRVLAAGFEMFQKPYQAALSGFVAGTLPEAQFLIESEYRDRWGFDFALYRPLLETARDNNLEVLALNTPRELTRKVGRTGIESLDAGERNQLPELDLTNVEHKAYFDAAMSGHPMPPDRKPENTYAAQVLWDETMAETAAAWLSRSGQNSQLILFAGSGHCHEAAIPARITRRVQLPVLSVVPVQASQLAEFQNRQRYDWLLVLEDQAITARN
jgi:uncharacterized iron-regulated protein